MFARLNREIPSLVRIQMKTDAPRNRQTRQRQLRGEKKEAGQINVQRRLWNLIVSCGRISVAKTTNRFGVDEKRDLRERFVIKTRIDNVPPTEPRSSRIVSKLKPDNSYRSVTTFTRRWTVRHSLLDTSAVSTELSRRLETTGHTYRKWPRQRFRNARTLPKCVCTEKSVEVSVRKKT